MSGQVEVNNEQVIDRAVSPGAVAIAKPLFQKENPADIRITARMLEAAYLAGKNLSLALEEEDPSRDHKGTDFEGTDAFQRQMLLRGILPSSDPQRGVWADQVGKFWDCSRDGDNPEAGPMLFSEWTSRVWRKHTLGQNPDFGDANMQRFYMSSNPVSDVLFPAYIQGVARQKQIEPLIPLSAIVALTTPIDSAVYQAFYLEDDSDERTMRRVGESAEVPTATLTGGDHTIRVRKYGRRILMSYETVRRMRIDRLALHLALLAVQATVDKVNTGIDVLINGDGNTSPATTAATNYNIGTLDTGWESGDVPTMKGYMAFRMKWTSPYNCNVILGREAEIIELLMANAGTANTLMAQLTGAFGLGGVVPISNQFGPVLAGWTDTVAADKWLGIDNRFALEMVTEIGATLTETNKIISAQFNEIVMTESVAFAILDENANKILTLSS